jgi:hypothetical protein
MPHALPTAGQHVLHPATNKLGHTQRHAAILSCPDRFTCNTRFASANESDQQHSVTRQLLTGPRKPWVAYD